ncbi:hypothetical protein C7S18_03880 [Ahniella affigens]|uniref:Uncharacterized protein n=1 Tax=Ahniella affigens TaxID=2021234 RepID=A0A2P1PNG5_9GAMM|nr:hypothetical protein C7S18_03880 [Ahniella affigens]
MVLLAASVSAQAVDTAADEARIDALVTEFNDAIRKTAAPSLYGDDPGSLVAESPAAASSGTDSIAVPLDEPAVVDESDPADAADATIVDADSESATADAPVAPTTAPATDEIGKGPIKFEQLSKLIGRRIKVLLLSGRRYEGELTAVTDSECRVSVRMYGTGVTVMPIKKAHISAIELL